MHQTRTSTTICDRCLHKTPQREPQTPCKPRARARRGRRHRIRSSKRLGFPRARRRGRPRGERANEPDGSARRGERPAPWLMRRWGAALGLRPPPLLSDLRESERDREREREMGDGRRGEMGAAQELRFVPASPLLSAVRSATTLRTLARISNHESIPQSPAPGALDLSGAHLSSRCAVGPSRPGPARLGSSSPSRRLAAAEVAVSPPSLAPSAALTSPRSQ